MIHNCNCMPLFATNSSGLSTSDYYLLLIVTGILVFLLLGWLLYRIGKKLDYKYSWFAWIPIVNLYMMVDLSKRKTLPWYAALIILIIIVNLPIPLWLTIIPTLFFGLYL